MQVPTQMGHNSFCVRKAHPGWMESMLCLEVSYREVMLCPRLNKLDPIRGEPEYRFLYRIRDSSVSSPTNVDFNAELASIDNN